MPCDTVATNYREKKRLNPTKRVKLEPSDAFYKAALVRAKEWYPGTVVRFVEADSPTRVSVLGYSTSDRPGTMPRRMASFRVSDLHELAHTFMEPTKTPPPVKQKTPAEVAAEAEVARVSRVLNGKEKPREDERVEVRHVRKGVRDDTVDFEFFMDEPVLLKLTPEQLAFKKEMTVEVETAAAIERPKGPQEYVLPDGTKAIQMPDGSLYVK